MTHSHPLVEHVAELRRHLGTRREVDHGVLVDGLALSTSWVPAGAEVHLRLVLESIFDGITVTGTVSAPWEGECRRCLGPVQGVAEADVREVFETRPTDGETWPLTGDEIDLEPMVRDAVLLSLPLAPLCSEDCLGPAPDLFPARPEVDEAEGGAGPPADPRWAALDDLDLGTPPEA